MLRSILLLGICWIVSLNATTQTMIPSGEVSGQWSAASSPYQIQGDITIINDSTLRIGPGVVVEFQGHYSLQVNGSLLAIGTEEDSITFTVNDTTGLYNTQSISGGWHGIRFTETPENQDTSKVMYCRLEYGKAIAETWPDNAGGALTAINFHKLVLSNNTFINNLAGGSPDASGGAIHLNGSDILIHHNSIIHNQAGGGGGIYFIESNPVFSNNLIAYNTASEGSGIFGINSQPSFSHDRILNNQATDSGGGILFHGMLKGSSMDSVVFEDNSANWGGGLGMGNCVMTLVECSFKGNTVTWLGGGIAADFSTVEIIDCLFENDTTSDTGGAIHLDHGNVQILNSHFAQNKAFNGGAINTDHTLLNMDGTTFFANSARGNGGAMHMRNSDLLLQQSVVDKNTAGNEGAGIFYEIDSLGEMPPYEIQLVQSSLTNNIASIGGGGAILRQTATDLATQLSMDETIFSANQANVNSAFQVVNFTDFTITNSSIVNNISNTRTSGAIFNNSKGWISNTLFAANSSLLATSGCAVNNNSNIDFMHCGFVDNVSGNLAALHIRRGSRATATNCIFWNNGVRQININSTVDSLSCHLTINHCLVQDGPDSVRVDELSTLLWGEGNLDIDPLFVDQVLGDYHLTENSPAIGAGITVLEINGALLESPPNDLEGNERPHPVGTPPDIGPFESPLGQSTPVQVWEENGMTLQIFPNPVNEQLFIDVSLDRPSQVTIEIVTLDGVLMTSMGEDRYEPGNYRIACNTDKLQSGVYILSVRVDNHMYGRKMMVIH